jgi:hypothetical protein
VPLVKKLIWYPKEISPAEQGPATLIVSSADPIAFFLFCIGDEDHGFLEFLSNAAEDRRSYPS